MKELVEVIAKALVNNPDEVVVTETETDRETVLEMKVAPPIWVKSSASRAVLQKPFVP